MRLTSLLALALLSLPAMADDLERGIEIHWAASAAGLRYEEALSQLPDPSTTREHRLARAALLLAATPRRSGQVEEAAKLLESVTNESPTDSLGCTARFLHARIDHLHRTPSDPGAAMGRYRALLEDGPPGHPFVAQAAVKLALLELYQGQTSTDDFADRLGRAAALLPYASTPSALRDLRLALARAALFHRRSDLAWPYLAPLDISAIRNHSHRADAWITLSEVAAELGHLDRARTAYLRFLQENPRDSRAHAVRVRLETLPLP